MERDRTPAPKVTDKSDDWRADVGAENNSGSSVDRARAREPGRGREANGPEQIPPRGWRDVFGRVFWSISEDRNPIHLRQRCVLRTTRRLPGDRGHCISVRTIRRCKHDRQSPVPPLRFLAWWGSAPNLRTDHAYLPSGERDAGNGFRRGIRLHAIYRTDTLIDRFLAQATIMCEADDERPAAWQDRRRNSAGSR